MPEISKTAFKPQNGSGVSTNSKWRWMRIFARRNLKQKQSVMQEDADQSHEVMAGLSQSDAQMEELSMEDIVNEEQVCLLCLQIPSTWFAVAGCGCQFCLQCMEMYTLCSVRSGHIPITCPDGRCPLISAGSPRHLTQNEVKHLVPNDVFTLFLRLQTNKEVAVNPDLIWCPRPGCETVCIVSQNSDKPAKKKLFGFIPISGRRKNQVVTCSDCNFSFCSRCRTSWHRGAPCPTAKMDASGEQQNINDDPILSMENAGLVKRCPFCQVPIERDEGCAQMMCRNCRHVFCWFCMASLDDDFMLRHYDSGPCRSRLGHSRVSVVWHRAQVVSAFLGLGVLFLITSPLILLISPCFLCCWRSTAHSSSSTPSTPTSDHDS